MSNKLKLQHIARQQWQRLIHFSSSSVNWQIPQCFRLKLKRATLAFRTKGQFGVAWLDVRT